MTLEPWIEQDKRRGTFVVRWRDLSGKKCRDSYLYSKRSDAKARKDDVREQLVNQSLGRVDLSRSPKECVDKFLEDMERSGSARLKVSRPALARFLALKDSEGRPLIRTLADLTRDNILNYMTSLQAAKLSQHTIQTYVSGCIRRWLGWCVDHHWLAVLPYTKIRVKSPKKIDRFFTDQEILDFEKVIKNPDFLCLFRLGYRCGLRVGERLRIRSEHVSWDAKLKRGEIYIPPDEAKTEDSGRYAELPLDVYELLPKRTGLLFPDWSDLRLTRVYRLAKLRAKIEDKLIKGQTVYKTLYWTRHTYAKRYLERGGSLKMLSTRMGHASIEITADVYGRLERTAIHDIVVPPVAGQTSLNDFGSAGQMQGNAGQNEQTDEDGMGQFAVL